MCTSIEDFGDGLERLLSGRVPNLQLESDSLHAHEQGTKLYTHGHLMVFSELVVTHAMHQTGLADARVTNDDQLEQEVLLQRGGSTTLRGYDFVL